MCTCSWRISVHAFTHYRKRGTVINQCKGRKGVHWFTCFSRDQEKIHYKWINLRRDVYCTRDDTNSWLEYYRNLALIYQHETNFSEIVNIIDAEIRRNFAVICFSFTYNYLPKVSKSKHNKNDGNPTKLEDLQE